MELAEGYRLHVIDGVQFCRNEMKRIKTAFPPDIIFTRVPDRPVIGQKISFSPSGGDLDDFVVSQWFHIDPDGFDAFFRIAGTQSAALLSPHAHGCRLFSGRRCDIQ